MKRVKLLILSISLLTCGLGTIYGIIFYQLPNTPMFSYWNVAGYDPGDPIILTKGEDKEMYIAAVAPFDIKEFNVKANIVFSGIQIEFPIDYKLEILNTPIPEGTELQCRINFPVLKSFPSTDGMLVLTFYGQEGKVIAGGAATFSIR